MNYRHAYHAGNFGDVLKHLILTEVIGYLLRKPTAIRIIDLHAGSGLYDLSASAATATNEWQDGIAKIFADDPTTAPSAIANYLSVVKRFNPEPQLVRYPGSPVLARALIRPNDVVVANELHPNDHAALARHFARDSQVRIMQLDAWTAIKSLLPPKERRGLILIDPPFEQPGEFKRMTAGLAEALSRFANGVYLLWYPIKDYRPITSFHRHLTALAPPKTLVCELLLQTPNNPNRLSGAGVVIVNPPYQLDQTLADCGTWLVSRLSDHPARRLDVRWLVTEHNDT